MANSRTSSNGIEQVQIDAAPGSGGYWTNAVSMRRGSAGDIHKMYFTVRESEESPSAASVMTPTLQFKGSGDDGWTDYNNNATDFAIGDAFVIDANALALQWRAGVKEGDFTSGSCNIGFSW